MIEVGVRELKNNLSRYLDRVARGERIRVTSRGKAIADIAPTELEADEDAWRDRLIAEGRLTPRSHGGPPPPPPEPLALGVSLTELVLRDREDDPR